MFTSLHIWSQTHTTTAAHVALDIATVAAGPSPIAPVVSGPGSSTHASLPLHSRAGSSHLHSRRAGDALLRRRHRSAHRNRNSGAAATGVLQPPSYSATNNNIHFFSIRPPASRRPTAEPTQPLSLPPQSLGGPVVVHHLFLLCFPPRPSRDLLFLTHVVHM